MPPYQRHGYHLNGVVNAAFYPGAEGKMAQDYEQSS